MDFIYEIIEGLHGRDPIVRIKNLDGTLREESCAQISGLSLPCKGTVVKGYHYPGVVDQRLIFSRPIPAPLPLKEGRVHILYEDVYSKGAPTTLGESREQRGVPSGSSTTTQTVFLQDGKTVYIQDGKFQIGEYRIPAKGYYKEGMIWTGKPAPKAPSWLLQLG